MKRFTSLLLAISLLALLGGCKKKTPEQSLQEAQMKIRSNDLIGARIDLKEMLKKHPEGDASIQARFLLGQCYFAEQDFAQCRKNMKIIFDEKGWQDPAGQSAFEFMINSYFREGLAGEGFKEADALSKQIPVSDDFGYRVHSMAAELLLADNRSTESLERLAEIMDKGKDHVQRTGALDRMVAIYSRSGQLDKCIGIYSSYLDKYPDFEDANDYMTAQAFYYDKMGQEEKAEEIYEKAAAGYEKMLEDTLDESLKARTLFRYGKSYELRQNYEKAREIYETLIKDYGDTPAGISGKVAMGDSWYVQGKPQEALKYFQALRNENDQNPQLIRMLNMRISSLMKQAGAAQAPADADLEKISKAAEDSLNAVKEEVDEAASDLKDAATEALESAGEEN